MSGAWENLGGVDIIRARLKHSVLAFTALTNSGTTFISGVQSGVTRYIVAVRAFSTTGDVDEDRTVYRVMRVDASGAGQILRTVRLNRGLSGGARELVFEWKNKRITQPTITLHAGESLVVSAATEGTAAVPTFEADFWDDGVQDQDGQVSSP